MTQLNLTKEEKVSIGIAFILFLFLMGGIYIYEKGKDDGRNQINNLLKDCEELNKSEFLQLIEFDSTGTTFSFLCYKSQYGRLYFNSKAREVERLDWFSEWVKTNQEYLFNNGGGLTYNN